MTLVWSPQVGPQHALATCPTEEVFFGGARGGGKTDGVLGKWALRERRLGPHFNAIGLRKTTVSFDDAIERSKQIFGPLGGKFNEAKLTWRMPHGGRARFGYLETISDADNYQGKNVTDVWVEEVGQYSTTIGAQFLPRPIARMKGVMRGPIGVTTQMLLTGNPGGPGQHWVAKRYGLIPFPASPRIVSVESEDGLVTTAAVIPSRVEDNHMIDQAAYVRQLRQSGSGALVSAWLRGDWTAIEGAFFDCWDAHRHVIDPIDLPAWWFRYKSGDWGSAKPFSIGWWAVASEPIKAGKLLLPRGCLIRYREWYGSRGPNVGLKMTADEVAVGIVERQKNDPGGMDIQGVLDPSAFAEDGGPSIAERMGEKGVYWSPADNRRVGRDGALGGWDTMRSRMKGDDDGNPMIVCFSTCTDSIRTIPVLQHDKDRAEDLDTESEDHAADEWRYACMARPWMRNKPSTERKKSADYKPVSDRGGGEGYVTL